MALSDASQMLAISTAYGTADANLQSILATTGSVAQAEITTARQTVFEQTTDADFDKANTWTAAIRATELSLTNTITPILNSAVKAIEAYYVGQYATKTRIYFKTGVTWTDAFRALWRRVMNEELIVELGSITNSAGTWGSYTTSGKSIALNTALECRVTSAATTTVLMTVNIVLGRADSTSQLLTFTIPVGTAVNTVIHLTNSTTSTWTNVVSLSVTGGSASDQLQIWVS